MCEVYIDYMRFLLIISLLLFSLHASFAQEAENGINTEQQTTKTETAERVRLISPIGAIVRSAVVPGWGQFHSRSYFRGSLTVLGVGGSIIGALLAQNSFRNRYDAYEALVWDGFSNEKTILESYEYANQRYKLRTFFMYTGIGIWLYSLIDSYVSANFYNATTLIQSIEQDAQNIEKLGIEIGATPSHFYFGIVKTF
ncbi:MAG: DUF5683 domain-containing protein [Candidatus Poribacteria bacterium]|nr:DUF5683 domain-containing protein [Candidatus Poribacteria bacterium]